MGRTRGGALAIAATLALASFALVLLTLFDPGLTIDEPINGGHGRTMMLAALRRAPFHHLSLSQTIVAIWRRGHEHPPLARFLIGVAEFLNDPSDLGGPTPSGMGGRLASATAFAGIVGLATYWTTRRVGMLGGLFAGASAILMPRLFAHAHFASPEMISAFFFLAALLAGGWAMEPREASSNSARVIRPMLAGMVLGLALLTKLTVVLMPIAAMLAALSRPRTLPTALASMAVGGLVFCLGWPWLWPLEIQGYPPGLAGSTRRLTEFLNTGVERAPIYVEYFGTQYPGPAGKPPWHYVWVFFLTTLPLGTLFLISIGVAAAWRMGRTAMTPRLLVLSLAVILFVFSLPIERYDGERLFLMAFPLATVFAGLGADRLSRTLARWMPRPIALAAPWAMLAPAIPTMVALHPFELSYYNFLVGGLPGAAHRGLEATYWGDTLAPVVLDRFAERIPPGAKVALLPTLYSGHAALLTAPMLRTKGIQIVPGDQIEREPIEWVILWNRGGYLGDPLPQLVAQTGTLIDEENRAGVWLTRLYRRAAPAPKRQPADNAPGSSN